MKNNKRKYLVYLILGVALIHSFLLLTGNMHFYSVMRHTVLKGRLGPSIDEYFIHPNRTVHAGIPKPWPKDEKYNQAAFTEKENEVHKKYQTVSFCVIRDGQLVFDYYAPGYSDTSKTNSWSVAKSIVSILLGIAIREGEIESLDEPIDQYLPEYQGSGITLRHLLAMSSGINFVEQYMNPFGFAAKALYGKDNRKLAKNYKPVSKPMQIFDYQSGNTLLLGYVLKAATGKSVSEYASEKLWSRIGAEHPALWSLDAVNQEERAFCCFNSNATDFARIGQLYLNQGIWEGDTIVNPDFVRETTSLAPLKLKEGTTNDQYAYHWWVTRFNDEQIFYARGIQGQYIFVIPTTKTVIVRLGRKRDEEKVNGVPPDVWEYLKMGTRIAAAS